ncbi:hypothetical protein ASO20_02595 [Mycoplasma sp. (ex Biomphalaria glabrata)]|uniref:ROK family protein n=1 Tax=Mycoplasma sp. (ex Biomphalaria glabrata) TaxID=1749074 RepID=UPI00073AD41F|nr:ROK family protein [Mycoplasma sp. (ex Biomphalaria glabrata)]ALV23524.1 hypothetical protein ASO20_02595 [Mycoplasma sp. (ex Biomphalaria glabrata)]
MIKEKHIDTLTNNAQLIVAIDMGGRTAKVAIADTGGWIYKIFVIPTKKGDDAIPFFALEIKKELENLGINYETQVQAIGFGCVGPLDIDNEISVNAGKIGWYNYPAAKVARECFKKPVYLINDARAIAVGEWKQGAGKGYKNFIIFSIGTGVGGGIIINNRLYGGAHNLANEFGHGGMLQSKYRCNCGLEGCLEGLSSATGIEKYFQDYIKENPNSTLAKRQKELNKIIEIKDIADLLIYKDHDATIAMSEALKPLCQAISMQIFAFDPEAVLIGGGPSSLGQTLLDMINSHLQKMVWPDLLKLVDIKICELQNTAGIVGVMEYAIAKIKGYEI